MLVLGGLGTSFHVCFSCKALIFASIASFHTEILSAERDVFGSRDGLQVALTRKVV